MPPVMYIEDEFLTRAITLINQDRYKDHNIITTNNDIDEEEEDNLVAEINNQIVRTVAEINGRMANGRLITSRTLRWSPNGIPRYHITLSDLTGILAPALPICDSCGNTRDRVSYSADATENGSATLYIEEGATDHEGEETNTSGTFTYFCGECGDEIDEKSNDYFIPAASMRQLKEMLQTFINHGNVNTDGLIQDEGQTQENQARIISGNTLAFRAPTNNRRDGFPDGKQLQHDIKAHGPAGPSMTQDKKGIRKSYPENFVFRSIGMGWKCKHCENNNRGETQRCSNKECQKDKYAPVKDIKLT